MPKLTVGKVAETVVCLALAGYLFWIAGNGPARLEHNKPKSPPEAKQAGELLLPLPESPQ